MEVSEIGKLVKQLPKFVKFKQEVVSCPYSPYS